MFHCLYHHTPQWERLLHEPQTEALRIDWGRDILAQRQGVLSLIVNDVPINNDSEADIKKSADITDMKNGQNEKREIKKMDLAVKVTLIMDVYIHGLLFIPKFACGTIAMMQIKYITQLTRFIQLQK